MKVTHQAGKSGLSTKSGQVIVSALSIKVGTAHIVSRHPFWLETVVFAAVPQVGCEPKWTTALMRRTCFPRPLLQVVFEEGQSRRV